MSDDHARRRYLTAKRSVDDRARDRRVRDRLLRLLPNRPRVGEAGCGTGLAVPSLREWGVTPRSYHGVDTDPGIVTVARSLVPRALRRRGDDVTETATGCRLEVGDGSDDSDGNGDEAADATVRFEAGDALTALVEAAPPEGFDLLFAQSFLDLVPLGEALDAFERALAPGGLAYAPLTFDGETIFLPEHPADERVLGAFHADIDATPGRDSRAGRHLLDRLRERDATIEAVAASDWVVRPVESGEYRADERYFLASILEFVADADAVADVDGAAAWLDRRRRQLAAGELTYVAHGYDLLWRPGAAATGLRSSSEGETEDSIGTDTDTGAEVAVETEAETESEAQHEAGGGVDR
ncbi:MAG: SAM-dependent methyltransferase [Halolamina sp.]